MMKSYRWQYWNKDTMTLSEFKNVFLPWRNPHNSHLQNNYFKHNELHCKKWPKQIWGILTGDNQAYSTINQMEQICKLIKDVQIKMVPTLSCTQFSADITHLLCKGNYHWMAGLLFDRRHGFNQARKSAVNFLPYNSTESKQVKQEVSHAAVFPLQRILCQNQNS